MNACRSLPFNDLEEVFFLNNVLRLGIEFNADSVANIKSLIDIAVWVRFVVAGIQSIHHFVSVGFVGGIVQKRNGLLAGSVSGDGMIHKLAKVIRVASVIICRYVPFNRHDLVRAGASVAVK